MQVKTSTIFLIIMGSIVVLITAIPFWTNTPRDEFDVALEKIEDGKMYQYTVVNITKDKKTLIRFDSSLRKKVDIEPGNDEVAVFVKKPDGGVNMFYAEYDRVNTVKEWPKFYVLEFKESNK